jgi:hypothetical protein
MKLLTKVSSEERISWKDFDYKEFGAEPKITLSNLTLALLCPILISAHIMLAQVA